MYKRKELSTQELRAIAKKNQKKYYFCRKNNI